MRWSEANRSIEAAVDNVRGLRVWGVRAENGRINGWATDPESEEDVEGDPTDGAAANDVTGSARQKAIEACVRNWKAAASDAQKKSMWEIFDETGIFAAACRHGFILIVVDMVRSGEL